MDKNDARRKASTRVDHLAHVRLRAPKGHGQTLDIPAKTQVAALLRDNLELRESTRQSASPASSDFPLKELQTLARTEAIGLAIQWTNQYLPVEAIINAKPVDTTGPIVFGGHQPTLFHPGVWYKNFRLHQIAQATGATAINIVVDNDISGSASIKFPQNAQGRATVGLVAFDAPGAAIPFEMQSVVDRGIFESFGRRAADAIEPLVVNPIITKLWPEVIKAERTFCQSSLSSRLGHAIAAGRHSLEYAHGLRTLEVPISRLAGSSSFAKFAGYLIQNLNALQGVYNQVITRYRKKHGIRSSAHPVPELNRIEDNDSVWLEAPFWIWTDQSPLRQPMFVRQIGSDIEISNSKAKLARVPRTAFSHWLVEQNQQVQLTGAGIFIRPRALITTMFTRLLASDLFVHGIGGAKYDQLTDQIIVDFFGVASPRYITSTSTWRLPTNFPEIAPADITARKQTLREMQFHPETFLSAPNDESKRWIDSKHTAIAGELDQSPLDRHHTIESANHHLQQLLIEKQATITDEVNALSKQIRNSQILNSREYSFCLHPIELISQLK